MMKQTRCYGCDKPIEPEWLPEGEFIVCDECSPTTDKLSVEKLQEHLLPYSKEMVQKIRDEKMQLVTADEFVKLHKESLTAIRENDKLQERCDRYEKALTEIVELSDPLDNDTLMSVVANVAGDALAAIGDEGSGDE